MKLRYRRTRKSWSYASSSGAENSQQSLAQVWSKLLRSLKPCCRFEWRVLQWSRCAWGLLCEPGAWPALTSLLPPLCLHVPRALGLLDFDYQGAWPLKPCWRIERRCAWGLPSIDQLISPPLPPRALGMARSITRLPGLRGLVGGFNAVS